jgi:hypothetical protein
MKVSEHMQAIIVWLLHYPGIRIQWTGGRDRPRFNSYWANERARQMMIKTCSDLQPLFGNLHTEKTEPRWSKALEGGTPRVTRRTFHALRRRGLVRAVEKRVPKAGWSNLYYYQLTSEGKQVAASLILIKPAEGREIVNG